MASKRSGKAGEPIARLVIYRDRAIGIRWSLGDRKGEISTGTTDREEAIGQKALLLRDLVDGRVPNRGEVGEALSWAHFRCRFKEEFLSLQSEGYRGGFTTAANHLERIIKPRRLADVDKAALSRFNAKLVAEGKSKASAATYVRTIRAALGWAEEFDLIPAAPRVRLRKGEGSAATMRSRPVNGEEFERILMAVPKVRATDADDWVFFLRGLRESSLRVDELRRLSWDNSSDLAIDTSGKYPMIRMLAPGHKSRRDCLQPITPGFWRLIDRPGVPRSGYVFPLRGRSGQMTRRRVIVVVSDIGDASGVITDPVSKKTATSHDIGRRAFLTEMAGKLTTSQTQQFARHADPRTTMQFYVRHEAEALAEAAGWP